MSDKAQLIMAQIQSASELSAADALHLVNEVYANGIVTRTEAEALFRLNDQLSLLDSRWRDRFVEAMKDFLLTQQPPEGWVTQEETEWLIGQVQHDGRVCSYSELDLLLSVLRHAEGAPAELGRFTLRAVCHAARAEGRISAAMSERLRKALFAPAGMGAVWVTREEADMLFELNDALARASNDKAWNLLFARAIANHLMARIHPTPDGLGEALAREKWLQQGASVSSLLKSLLTADTYSGWFEKAFLDQDKVQAARSAAREAAASKAAEISEEEEGWFKRRLGWDKAISPAERALVEFLRDEVPGLVNGLAAAA